jgi:uncharacterized protein
MFLQFAVENYLSFRDRAVLSMLADPRVEHAPGQVLEGPGGRKVLRAAAVYGANGAGKSNLVKALDVMRDIVLRGTRGEDPLPVVPFKLDPAKRNEPAHFEMEIAAAGKHYSYGFEASAKQVEAEWLHESDPDGEERLLFEREAGRDKPRITVGDALSADPKRRGFLEYVADGTRQNQLFMAEAGERNVVELEPVRKAIRGWTIVAPDAPYLPLLDRLQGSDDFKKVIASVLKEGGTGIHDLRVQIDHELLPPDVATVLKSARTEVAAQFAKAENAKLSIDDAGRMEVAHLFAVHRLPTGEQIELSMNEESDGTRRLLNLAPILHPVEEVGPEPLFVIDELERSLHPLLSRMLLQLFFARVGSGAAAQIIFTTHDTNLLDLRILSRDSVWFMEKDVRGGSIMYPLSEFDQAQLDAIEKQGRSLEKGYLQGRFGAIPFFGSLEALGFRKDLLK